MTQDAGQNGAVETSATDWAALAQAFRAREVQDLGPLVRRVTARNAGMMTGPGTNSYLVGRREVAVIDPGPADAAHVQRIVDAAPGPIRQILLTHRHPDHAPGAALLAERTGAPIRVFPSGPHGLRHPLGTPLADGEVIETAEFRLRAVHTPGHAADHVCFLLENERLLFAGDQVMEGATVVIAPPDGHMGQYLTALARLQGLDLAAIAPAHGRVLCDPGRLLAAIVTHRRQREAKVLAALQCAGQGTPETLVAEVYADTPAFLHLAARLSLQAHLIHLVENGQARFESGIWHALAAP